MPTGNPEVCRLHITHGKHQLNCGGAKRNKKKAKATKKARRLNRK